MTTAYTQFETIANQLITDHDSVTMGKMMSSPAVMYQEKVFAFFHNQMMTFKLGETFRPEDMDITDYHLLAPFKTRPPMRAWFSIPYAEHQHWETLANYAPGTNKNGVVWLGL